MSYLTEISYHRYGSFSTSSLQGIASRAKQYNLGASMLEWWNGSNTFQTLHQDIKVGRNSAWQAKILASPSTSPQLSSNIDVAAVDVTDPNNPIAAMTHGMKYLRQYFKFVRSGAQRIEAASSDGSFDPLAFINEDGNYVVVVKAAAGGAFSVQGLPAGAYGIKFTTGDGKNQPLQYDVDLPDANISAGQNLIASIPAAGIITIYGK